MRKEINTKTAVAAPKGQTVKVTAYLGTNGVPAVRPAPAFGPAAARASKARRVKPGHHKSTSTPWPTRSRRPGDTRAETGPALHPAAPALPGPTRTPHPTQPGSPRYPTLTKERLTMTTTGTTIPIWRRRWAQATGAVLALALIGGAAAGGATLAGPHATVIRPAANTAPATTPKAPEATPKPGKVTPPAPAASSARPLTPVPAGPDRYAQDILDAGITAPVSWIGKTGQQLVADWRAGYTAAWTDANVLTPGGVLPGHLATFDEITARDFGATPPAQGIQPAAPAAPAANPAESGFCTTGDPGRTGYCAGMPPATGQDLRPVGNGIYAGSATSDAFARNVVTAWDGTPGVKDVYSPATGQFYAMTYQIVGAGTVIATGGNGAYVQF